MNTGSESIPRPQYEGVYRDTMYFVDAIVKEYDFYGDILGMIRDGSTEIEVKSRHIKKTVDESWVSAVEAALPALDMAIRSPGKFLEETEKVQPIELTKNITNRSLRHLAQHTDYISKVEGDMITPSKLLNVYRDETIMTYENKFLNTLIFQLYEFIDKRYSQMCGAAAEESTTKLEITSDFIAGGSKGKFTFGIELGEAAEVMTEKKEPDSEQPDEDKPSADLIERVKRLHSAALMYVKSDFAASMGKAMVRPPIVHTNAITKNKYLRECLLLWEFIQGYHKIGYKIDIEETAIAPNKTYINQLYSMLALQYVIFRYNMDRSLELTTLAENNTEDSLEPKFVTDFKPFDENEFNVIEREARPVNYTKSDALNRKKEEELSLESAIDSAFIADHAMRERRKAIRMEEERLAALAAKEKSDAELARQRALERLAKLRAAELARKEKRRDEIAANKKKTQEYRARQKGK